MLKKKSKPKKNNKQSVDVVCVGGITQDIFFYSDQLQEFDNPKKDPNCLRLLSAELGAKIIGKKMIRSVGGGASNSAINFSNLGLKTAIISVVGSDPFGLSAINYFSENNIDCSSVKVIKNKETALSFLLSNSVSGNHSVFAYDGAREDLNITVEDLKKHNPKWLYVTSLSDNWQKVFKNIKTFLESSDCKLVWNPGVTQLLAGKEVLQKYIELCDIFVLNRDEATGLVAEGKNISVNEILEKVGELGANINVMTDGPSGVYVTIGKQRFFEPALSNLKPINTTGAGDAFSSTLVASLHKGVSLQLAMRYAVRQSSNILKSIGAQTGLKKWNSLKNN